MERPKFNEAMALELAQFAAEYLGCDSPFDEDELRDIAKVLTRHWSDNGFELAKEFEDVGYNIEMHIVDSLDRLSEDANDILKKHIEDWVISDKITLDLKPGDGVMLNRPIQGEHYGIIYDLRIPLAQYAVRIEKLSKSPTHCYVINAEDLTFVPPAQRNPDEWSVATDA